MATGEYMIGNEKLPAQLNMQVLVRFMNIEDLAALYSKYKENRKSLRHEMSAPTEEQYQMAQMRKEGAALKDVVNKFNSRTDIVAQAVKRVAIWNYLKG